METKYSRKFLRAHQLMVQKRQKSRCNQTRNKVYKEEQMLVA